MRKEKEHSTCSGKKKTGNVLSKPIPGVIPISVVIITQDEEERTANAIRSCLNFSDEIVVVDGNSRDKTVQLCQNLGCRVYVNAWDGYANQRKFGIQQAKYDWIFMIDSDEVVSEELAQSILSWKSLPDINIHTAFEVNRVNDFLGTWLCSDVDNQVRLFNKTIFQIKDVLVHEGIDPGAAKSKLPGTLWHYGFRSIHDQANRSNKYTNLEAQQDCLNGKKFSLVRLLLKPPARFLKRYFLCGLFKKGLPGFSVAVFWSYYDFLKEMKLYEMGLQTIQPYESLDRNSLIILNDFKTETDTP
jgi:glycosyltransferase involved in cell wall biosynthesis